MALSSEIDTILDKIGQETRHPIGTVLTLLHHLRPTKPDGTTSLWSSYEPPEDYRCRFSGLEMFEDTQIRNVSPSDLVRHFNLDLNSLQIIATRDAGLTYKFKIRVMPGDTPDTNYNCSFHLYGGTVTLESLRRGLGGIHHFEAQGWIAYFGKDPTPR